MDRFYVYSLVPVVAVALLLFFSSVLHARRTPDLAMYCLAIATWSGGHMLIAFPSTTSIGQRLVAAGGFVVAGFLHAAYDLLGEKRRAWLWSAYLVAALILLAQVFQPGLIHDAVRLQAGPWFFPSMLAALVAATVPLRRLVSAAVHASGHDRASLVELAVAGALGYCGAASHAILSSRGRPQPTRGSRRIKPSSARCWWCSSTTPFASWLAAMPGASGRRRVWSAPTRTFAWRMMDQESPPSSCRGSSTLS